MIAALILLAALGGWEAYVRLGGIDPLVLPAPSEVGRSLVDDRGLIAGDFGVTAREMLLGLGCALVVAALLTLMLHLVPAARRGLMPLLIGSQALPVPLVAPLLVAWLGFGIAPKLVIVAVVCFFPVVLPTLDALRRADPDRVKLLRTLGATRWQALRFHELPGALPALFTGTRLAVAVAAISAVFAEQAGSESGLGRLALRSINQLETARAYAAIVVLMAFTLLLYGALLALERKLLPWARPATTQGPA